MSRNIEPPSLRLYILATGYIGANDAPFIKPNGEVELVTTTWYSGCYLLQHPLGWLLWDTGLPDSMIDAPSRGTTFHFAVTRTLTLYLGDLDLAPQDIKYVAFSHLHPDHVGNVAYFTDSTLLIHGREYGGGLDLPQWLTPEERMALEKSQTIEIWDKYDVFDDGSVLILEAPGHSIGHQVLLARLPKTGPVLLSGDLYYSPRDRVERLVPQWNSSREQSLDSMERIEEIIDDTQALLIIHHDQKQHAALPHFPAYLE